MSKRFAIGSGTHVLAQFQAEGIDEDRIYAIADSASHTDEEAAFVASMGHVAEVHIVTSIAHFPRAPFVFGHFVPLDQLPQLAKRRMENQ
ncbi:MAG: ElyC/SanA/YdcF family protein [Pseudomonadota bacterium]